jgi:hypothetical protein
VADPIIEAARCDQEAAGYVFGICGGVRAADRREISRGSAVYQDGEAWSLVVDSDVSGDGD